MTRNIISDENEFYNYYQQNFNNDFVRKYDAISRACFHIETNISDTRFSQPLFSRETINKIIYDNMLTYVTFDKYNDDDSLLYPSYTKESRAPIFRNFPLYKALHDFVIKYCPYNVTIKEIVYLSIFVSHMPIYFLSDEEIGKKPFHFDEGVVKNSQKIYCIMSNMYKSFARDEYGIKIEEDNANNEKHEKAWQTFVLYTKHLIESLDCFFYIHEKALDTAFSKVRFNFDMPLSISIPIVFCKIENCSKISCDTYVARDRKDWFSYDGIIDVVVDIAVNYPPLALSR